MTIWTKEDTGDAPTARPRLRERHVLCVDDDRDFLKSLEFFLPGWINRGSDDSRLWYRFLFMDDPREALEAMRDIVAEGEKVALVISDQMMPGMKGTAFLAESRAHSPTSARALLTGHAGIESAIAAINTRLLDRYLTKPIESEEEFALNTRHLLEEFETRTDLQDRNDLIERLYLFSNELNARQTIEETVEIILRFASLTLSCQRVNVVLSTLDDHPWALGDVTVSEAEPEAGQSARVGLARTLEEIPGGSAMPSQGPGPFAYGTLRDRSTTLGWVVASGPAGGVFGDADLRHLGHLCDTAAIAISNQLSRRRLLQAWTQTQSQAVQLEAANCRLRILDKLRGDFLAFISHELRTPLSYFSAMNLFEQATTREETAELMGFIRRGYQRLERFVTKGLDYFGWLGADRVAATTATDLARLARQVVAAKAEADSGSRFDVIGDVTCWASIELAHAEEILHVLFDNAIKFSEPDQRVRVRVENVDGGARVVVADQGRGFPPEWTSEIFHPFTVVESQHHREGTALSLAKIAEMVRSYGGTLIAASDGLGKGATFTVDLPRGEAEEGGESEVEKDGPAARAA